MTSHVCSPCGWRHCCWRLPQCCQQRQWQSWRLCRGCLAAHAGCRTLVQQMRLCCQLMQLDRDRRRWWHQATHSAGSSAGSGSAACKTDAHLGLCGANIARDNVSAGWQDSTLPVAVLCCAMGSGQVGILQSHLLCKCICRRPGKQRVAAVLHHQPSCCGRLPGGLQSRHRACSH